MSRHQFGIRPFGIIIVLATDDDEAAGRVVSIDRQPFFGTGTGRPQPREEVPAAADLAQYAVAESEDLGHRQKPCGSDLAVCEFRHEQLPSGPIGRHPRSTLPSFGPCARAIL
jgi:hypothetical protein